VLLSEARWSGFVVVVGTEIKAGLTPVPLQYIHSREIDIVPAFQYAAGCYREAIEYMKSVNTGKRATDKPLPDPRLLIRHSFPDLLAARDAFAVADGDDRTQDEDSIEVCNEF
jgi:hypothetical protein